MTKKAIREILNLNKKYYQLVHEEFSKSRQKPWPGWDRAVNTAKAALEAKIEAKKALRTLDLGCGNGRFYKFIKVKLPCISYLGFDINNDLLTEAKKRNRSAKFVRKDIFDGLDSVNKKFEIVTAFGVTHHIPNEKFRMNWFLKLPKLLSTHGVLILTFWNFEKKPGDYLLGWNNVPEAARFCYQYSKNDITKIISVYKKLDVKLLDSFTADRSNLYLIFGKI